MVTEVGRIMVKISGRDAGKKAVVVDILDNNYVLIDGEIRRRKCNINHLEPLNQSVELKKGASHEEVASALKGIGIEARETKPKEKTERPKKERKQKVVAEEDAPKKAEKKGKAEKKEPAKKVEKEVKDNEEKK